MEHVANNIPAPRSLAAKNDSSELCIERVIYLIPLTAPHAACHEIAGFLIYRHITRRYTRWRVQGLHTERFNTLHLKTKLLPSRKLGTWKVKQSQSVSRRPSVYAARSAANGKHHLRCGRSTLDYSRSQPRGMFSCNRA